MCLCMLIWSGCPFVFAETKTTNMQNRVGSCGFVAEVRTCVARTIEENDQLDKCGWRIVSTEAVDMFYTWNTYYQLTLLSHQT